MIVMAKISLVYIHIGRFGYDQIKTSSAYLP